MRVYCLFCETEHCDNIRRAAEDVFFCRALSPKQIQHQTTKDGSRDIIRKLLPGYVLLYFEDDQPVPEPWRFRMLIGVIRLMSDSSHQYRLTGRDEEFAMNLFRVGGVLGKTPVYQEGERIRIAEGPFAGIVSRILKVDRRSNRMQVEIPFAGQKIATWVQYEIIEKE